MESIVINELGSIDISEELIEKIILFEMIKNDKIIIPCTKNGNIFKSNDFMKTKDSSGVVFTSFNDEGLLIEINYIAIFGKSLKKSAENIFNKIIDRFIKMGIKPPIKIIANIRGIISDNIASRDIKLIWHNGLIEVEKL